MEGDVVLVEAHVESDNEDLNHSLRKRTWAHKYHCKADEDMMPQTEWKW